MKVTTDIPGRRLLLDEDETPSRVDFIVTFLLGAFPFLLGLTLASLILSTPDLPADPFGDRGSGTLAPERRLALVACAVVAVLGVAFSFYRLLKASRTLRLLHVEGDTGELRLVERAVFGLLPSEERWPTSTIESIRLTLTANRQVEHSRTFGGLAHGPRLVATITAEGARPGRTGRTLDAVFIMSALQRDEMPDIAFRMGSAAGLTAYRVVRSDRREIEIELGRPDAGRRPIPDLGAQRPSPEGRAAAAGEVVPPFDPKTLRGEYAVVDWRPGEAVRIDRRFRRGVLGCLPFLVVPFVGVAVLARGPAAGTLLLLGVGIGLFLLLLGRALPERSVFDWRTRSVTLRRFRRTRVLPFAGLQAIELQALCHRPTRATGSTAYGWYRCAVRLHYKDADGQPASQLIVETDLAADPVAPWRQAFPLVTELERALGIERRISDRTGLAGSEPPARQ